jgi:hypothetical protein
LVESPVVLRQRLNPYKPALNGNENLCKIAHAKQRWITLEEQFKTDHYPGSSKLAEHVIGDFWSRVDEGQIRRYS